MRIATVVIAMLLILGAGLARAAEKGSTSCVEPARGPIMEESASAGGGSSGAGSVTASAPRARVGKPAPDFEANAWHDGEFKAVRLSDYKDKWVVLCFYPGDFTFV